MSPLTPVFRDKGIEKRLAFGQHPVVISGKAPRGRFVFHGNIAIESGCCHYTKQGVEINLSLAHCEAQPADTVASMT